MARDYRKHRPDKPPLYIVPLTWDHCKALAGSLSAEDSHECVAMGLTPLQSLAGSLTVNPSTSYAVIRRKTGTPVGAYGINMLSGFIWSLWGHMGAREMLQVREGTAVAVKALSDYYARCGHEPRKNRLCNFIMADNVRSLGWLRKAGCFEIADEPITGPDGNPWLYFEVAQHV